MTHLAWWPYIVLAGAGVGICTGLFGVGGSSVATPVLALLGAPGLIAVASPLPATIPSAAVGAIPYVRSHEARTHAAAWSILGGVPGTVAGALLSRLAGGPVLLIVSGLVLIAVGLRVILPVDEAALEKGAERRHHRVLLVATLPVGAVDHVSAGEDASQGGAGGCRVDQHLIFGLARARSCMIFEARSVSRRWITVKELANRGIRNSASSIAESPPPTTAMS